MAKLPVAGRVKTRLASEIGPAHATRFYRATMRSVLARLAGQPFWKTLVSVSPDSGVSSPMLPAAIRRSPQGQGDLGARMHRPMRTLPPGPVCLVGTDIPGIRPADIRKAFSELGRHDAVLGPAADGGFWLVGFRRIRRPPWVYEGVGWSRPDTLAQVLGKLGQHGLSVGITTRHNDVDDASDLARFSGAHGRLVPPFTSKERRGAG